MDYEMERYQEAWDNRFDEFDYERWEEEDEREGGEEIEEQKGV